MLSILIFFVIGLFIALVFLNVYFRYKVLKSYRLLIKNRIEFSAVHLFNKEKMAAEILPKYPQHQDIIKEFASHFDYSLKMASVIITLITILGGILMYFRE